MKRPSALLRRVSKSRKQTPDQGQWNGQGRRRSFERLEDRLCLSVAYDYSVIAKTGDTTTAGDTIDNFWSNDVSINNSGRVAFIAGLSGPNGGGSAVVVGDGGLLPGGLPVRVSHNPSTFALGFPQITNDNLVVAKETGAGYSWIRTWDSDIPGGAPTNIVSTKPSDPGYDPQFAKDGFFSWSLTLPSRADNGLVAFVGIPPTGSGKETKVYVNNGATNSPVASLSGSGFRPMIANSGNNGITVVADGSLTTNWILRNGTAIVSLSSGWNTLGREPGISDDGKVIAFYGDLSAAGAAALTAAQPKTYDPLNPGPGIFVYAVTPEGPVIQRVAGVSGNGYLDPAEGWNDANLNGVLDPGEDVGAFQAFSADTRIGVKSSLADRSAVRVVEIASGLAGKQGIYASDVSFDLKGLSIDISPPDVVVKVGDVISALSGPVSGFSLYDPINIRGQIAFWATDGSTQAVVRADPIRRPVLVIPGFLGSWVADFSNNLDFLMHRGYPPTELAVDPLLHVYDDLIQSLKNAGYQLNKDLFVVTYDWRLPPAPKDITPDGQDKTPDGQISDISAMSIAKTATDLFDYGVDYLGYFLRRAAETWHADHPAAPPLDSVDIIAHSTGGLVARSYMQSTAYGGSFGSLNLPEVNQYIMLGVPNRGASKAWNGMNDNFQVGDPKTFGLFLRPILNDVYHKVLAGSTVVGPPKGITKASISVDGTGDTQMETQFINQYVPTIRTLLATYDFGVPNINSDPKKNNWLVLDLNGGVDSNHFADETLGRDVAFYGFLKNSNGTPLLTTPSTVMQEIPTVPPMPYDLLALWPLHSKLPEKATIGDPYYRNVYGEGDSTVPLQSSRDPFQGDNRIDLEPVNAAHTDMVSDLMARRNKSATLVLTQTVYDGIFCRHGSRRILDL